MIKIYTKTGDKGQTSLIDGKRVSKASERVELYGAVDELNSSLGVVVAHLRASEKPVKRDLEMIQRDLFAIGSYLAGGERVELVRRVADFERQIDVMTKTLAPLKNFILPGGGRAGSQLHLSRTICRRVERSLVKFADSESIDPFLLQYFNRLSDLLFTMARFVNHKEKKKETIWSSNVNATDDSLV
jgi:cob(I)alamin adenosyltransferase